MYGRRNPVSLGQVGIRCMHCRNDPVMERGQQAVLYPSLISGINNSVQKILRMHFDRCPAIPTEVRRNIEELRKSTSSRGGRTEYWIDSAKRLGLIDTTHGIYFAHDPKDNPTPLMSGQGRDINANSKGRLPPLNKSFDKNNDTDKSDRPSKKKRAIHKAEATSELTYTSFETNITTGTSVEINNSNLHIAPTKPGVALVLPEDRPLTYDYIYLVFEQMQPTKLLEADQFYWNKKRKIGFPGFACKHCFGQARCARYFPASEVALSQSLMFQQISNHVLNCRRCPIATRESLELMKRMKLFPDGKIVNKPKHGGRKEFFQRLWCRIQGLSLNEEEESRLVHGDQNDDVFESEKTKNSTKPKRKNLADEKNESQSASILSSGTNDNNGAILNAKADKRVSSLKVGMKVKVYWPLDHEFYKAKITHRNDSTTTFTLCYEDGVEETIDMTKEIFEMLDEDVTEAKETCPSKEC